MGNVTALATTLPQGTDTQVFCYDEQNRLTWAGSTGTPPCASGAISSGTLPASAQYSASYSYDTLNRLTSSPAGSRRDGIARSCPPLTSACPRSDQVHSFVGYAHHGEKGRKSKPRQ